MSLSSLTRFYLSECNQITNLFSNNKKVSIILINNNMSCYIRFNSKVYLLYLKGVPKKKILKNYFKYLCSNEDVFLNITNIKDNSKNIVGILYTRNILNINKMLYLQYKYIQKKYIYETTIFNSSKLKKKLRKPSDLFKKYSPKLDTIIEAEVEA